MKPAFARLVFGITNVTFLGGVAALGTEIRARDRRLNTLAAERGSLVEGAILALLAAFGTTFGRTFFVTALATVQGNWRGVAGLSCGVGILGSRRIAFAANQCETDDGHEWQPIQLGHHSSPYKK